METQASIAKDADISAAYLSQIKNGLRRPSIDVAERLAALLPGSSPLDWMRKPADMLSRLLAVVHE